jgi:hypothetical protein
MEITEIRQAAPGKMLIINGSIAIPDELDVREQYGVEAFLAAGGRIRQPKGDPTGEATANMQRLERAQHRAVRELLLNPDDAAARRKLADLDAEIAALRGT